MGNVTSLATVPTSEAVWDVDFKFDVAEEHGQGHGEIALGPQRNVAVSRLQVLKGKNSLAQHFVVVVKDSEAKHCKLW